MKTLEFIKLNESGANNVVASLQQLLADFQVYYTNLRGFHWNIKGHDFFVLHSQFEKMYDDTAEKVDEIAERILMLGGTPANKFSDYLKVANINEVDKISNGEQALNNILQSISYLIGEERKILSIASQSGDEVTVSMRGILPFFIIRNRQINTHTDRRKYESQREIYQPVQTKKLWNFCEMN